MTSIHDQGTKSIEREEVEGVVKELNELKEYVTVRVKEIRERYFLNGEGLTVLRGYDKYEINFALDAMSLK